MKHVFGPVASRRLGFSLGVDLVPFKTCTLDCIYCQLGATTVKTIERRTSFSPEEVVGELGTVLTHHQKIDYITVSPCTAPTADFSGTPTSGYAPLTVDFTDLSTNATGWDWTFGDGGTSTAFIWIVQLGQTYISLAAIAPTHSTEMQSP